MPDPANPTPPHGSPGSPGNAPPGNVGAGSVSAAGVPQPDPAIDPHAPGCLDLSAGPLSGLSPMQVAVIERVEGDDEETLRLKSLGLCVGRKLQVVKPGDPLILRVLGSRLGLSRRLADRVYAQPCMLSSAGSPDPVTGAATTATTTTATASQADNAEPIPGNDETPGTPAS